jgi:hypothetical protein
MAGSPSDASFLGAPAGLLRRALLVGGAAAWVEADGMRVPPRCERIRSAHERGGGSMAATGKKTKTGSNDGTWKH